MQLERIQAARATATAAQISNNGAPPSSQTQTGSAPTPSQQPSSIASPLAVQSNLPPPVASTSTAANPTHSPRPTSSASASTPAFNNAMQTQIASPQQKTRPNTASSRRESIAAVDIKGKGKAVGDTGSIKGELFPEFLKLFSNLTLLSLFKNSRRFCNKRHLDTEIGRIHSTGREVLCISSSSHSQSRERAENCRSTDS